METGGLQAKAQMSLCCFLHCIQLVFTESYYEVDSPMDLGPGNSFLPRTIVTSLMGHTRTSMLKLDCSRLMGF